MEFSFEVLALLFLVAILAGFIDTLAGGGGLLTLPALVLTGIPPLLALATNKLQSSVGTGTVSFLLLKNHRISWNQVKYVMLSGFIGSAAGTIAVQFLNTSVLEFVIPCVLLAITIYFIFSSKISEDKRSARCSESVYSRVVVPAIGCYDGMFGPGTGSFFAMSGVAWRGLSLVSATACAKPMNFSTNIASLLVFASLGQVIWFVGFVMMLGQVIGAWCASHFLYKIKAEYLRAIVVTMCVLMLVKYLQSIWSA